MWQGFTIVPDLRDIRLRNPTENLSKFVLIKSHYHETSSRKTPFKGNLRKKKLLNDIRIHYGCMHHSFELRWENPIQSKPTYKRISSKATFQEILISENFFCKKYSTENCFKFSGLLAENYLPMIANMNDAYFIVLSFYGKIHQNHAFGQKDQFKGLISRDVET